MPAWSHEIGSVFVKLALADGKSFTQMHLQELVYTAHGWALSLTGEPLTGDRPEAFEYGAEYRRLANALRRWGAKPLTSEIGVDWTDEELSAWENALVARVYREYGGLETSHLALFTRESGTPWDHVYSGGAGAGKDISHQLVKAQFAELVPSPVE